MKTSFLPSNPFFQGEQKPAERRVKVGVEIDVMDNRKTTLYNATSKVQNTAAVKFGAPFKLNEDIVSTDFYQSTSPQDAMHQNPDVSVAYSKEAVEKPVADVPAVNGEDQDTAELITQEVVQEAKVLQFPVKSADSRLADEMAARDEVIAIFEEQDNQKAA